MWYCRMIPLRSCSSGSSHVNDKVRELMTVAEGFKGAPAGTVTDIAIRVMLIIHSHISRPISGSLIIPLISEFHCPPPTPRLLPKDVTHLKALLNLIYLLHNIPTHLSCFILKNLSLNEILTSLWNGPVNWLTSLHTHPYHLQLF